MEIKRKILILIAILAVALLPKPTFAQAKESIIWWQIGWGTNLSAADVTTWAVDMGFTGIACYGSLTNTEIASMQSAGLDVYEIWIAPQTPSPLNNWTETWTYLRDWVVAKNYDGLIMDDTQNVWGQAQANGTIDDDTYYQQFLSNATIVSSVIGEDKTIIEMAIYGDSPDYQNMNTFNCTGATFSYYYPPDPAIRYSSAFVVYSNQSANAWDMVTHYNTYGLNTYYAYQGWLWLFEQYATTSLTTYSLMQTYNSVIDLLGNYTGTQLMVYNVANLYLNGRIEPFLKEINDAFQTSSKLTLDKVYLQDFLSAYWNEDFAAFPGDNATEVNEDEWQIVNEIPDYDYNITAAPYSEYSMFIKFDGTNDAGYLGMSFERAVIAAEMGIHISLSVTPYNYSSWKDFIITGTYPYPNSYIVRFGYGVSQPLQIVYRNITEDDTNFNLTKWTTNSKYTLNYYLNETFTRIKIQNSTYSCTWNLTLANLKYNSMKTYSFKIRDFTGNWATHTTFTSCEVEDIQIDYWDRHLLDVSTYTQYEIEGNLADECNIYFSSTQGNPDKTLKNDVDMNVSTIVPYRCYNFSAITDDTFYISWGIEPILPFGFIMGMVGLVSTFGGSMWMIKKAKDHEINEAITEGFIIAIIGVALFIAWLWGA